MQNLKNIFSEKGSNLVKLLDVDSDFIVDLRYATSDNFTGEIIYKSGECYIDEHTCRLLIEAKEIFKKDGYRVKVWDAYRPISAQRKFWEVFPNNDFVARPPDMSTLTSFRPSHMSGMCVDITLTDVDGKDIEMPSQFDDLTERASLMCPLTSEMGRKNGEYLKSVMEKVGFASYINEWWHFYDVSGEPKPYSDLPL
jgi:D-alanyl-D-alanine dipeptidase